MMTILMGKEVHKYEIKMTFNLIIKYKNFHKRSSKIIDIIGIASCKITRKISAKGSKPVTLFL